MQKILTSIEEQLDCVNDLTAFNAKLLKKLQAEGVKI